MPHEYKVEVVRVVDGDTVDVDIDLDEAAVLAYMQANIIFPSTTVPIQTVSNIGGFYEIYKTITGTDLELRTLEADTGIYKRLEEKTAYLAAGIDKVLKANNVQFTINQIGSMISVHFDATPVVDFDSAAKGNNDTFKKFFHGLLNEGIYIAPSAFETWFITDALSYKDLDDTISAINNVAKTL